MKFAKYTFLIAGIYGLVVLLPQYFLEQKIETDTPPAITHPEFFYGFIGVAIAFQLVFLIISRDPQRYRLFILPSIVEKFSFGIAAAALFATGRLDPQMFAAGMIDTVLGLLFIVSWFKTKE
ncbi:MAG TPA: hypothetical protein PLP21_00475 [Pyrinomonadaceae bacterium]|mgnify:CR=1 FL=1|nr:hypothetical protein [Acidobacteriota bacterium]HQZ94754.1 hypothetical protein [Pyrinomonadaceae bacterium]